MRPAFCAVSICLVKGRNRNPKALRIPADLIEREKSIVPIERSVLHALGHDRPAVLLQLHGAAQRLVTAVTTPWLGD